MTTKNISLWYLSSKKREQVTKSVEKAVEKFLPSNLKFQVFFTSSKLNSRFNIKDKTKFEHKHDVTNPGAFPETTCNDNCIDKVKRRIFEKVKDYNCKDIKPDLLKHTLGNDHQYVYDHPCYLIKSFNQVSYELL